MILIINRVISIKTYSATGNIDGAFSRYNGIIAGIIASPGIIVVSGILDNCTHITQVTAAIDVTFYLAGAYVHLSVGLDIGLVAAAKYAAMYYYSFCQCVPACQ